MKAQTNNNFGQVAVLMGGQSGEREVSLASGSNVLAALQRSGVNAFAIDVGSDISQQLTKQPIDHAFIVLHGKGGEDGAVQGMLELLGIPYTGSGVMASALTMNKVITKIILRANGIPTPDFWVIDQTTDPQALVDEFGLPMCIKPIADGSTLGVSKVKTIEQIPAAIELASQCSGGVMVEPWIDARELFISILDDEALPIIEVVTKREYYDYIAKYETDDNKYFVPEDLAPELVEQLKSYAIKAFQATGCKTWGRVDVLLDKNNQPWITELNTIPGMTEHSLTPQAAKSGGLSYDDLVLAVLTSSARL